jgi:hypothetical protein
MKRLQDLGFSINILYNFEILRSKRTKYHMTHSDTKNKIRITTILNRHTFYFCLYKGIVIYISNIINEDFNGR